MRRLLRDVAEHRELGDVTTLLDPTVVNMIDDADAGVGRSRRGGLRAPVLTGSGRASTTIGRRSGAPLQLFSMYVIM